MNSYEKMKESGEEFSMLLVERTAEEISKARDELRASRENRAKEDRNP